MTDDIFGNEGTKTNANEPDDQNIIDSNSGHDTDPNPSEADLLKELVGEGKKYKTVADLVKGMKEKDSFIERLKEENGGMREDLAGLQEKLTKASTLDDVLSKITASRDSQSNQSLSDDEVRKIVDATLSERQTEAAQKANLEESQGYVLQKFNGDMTKAREFISEQAEALGMSKEDLMKVAMKSPKGFAQLVGTSTTKGPTANQPSARSSEYINNSGHDEPEVGTKAYYDKMRRENPSQYWLPKTQQQMLKDADKDFDKFMGRK